jgi:hypothetical protein
MQPDERTRQERKIDEALEQTFPASDTPSFVGAGAGPDKPAEKKVDAHDGHPGRRIG